MPLSYIFWATMLLWLIVGVIPIFRKDRTFVNSGDFLLSWALFAMLGWQVFGSAIKG